MSAQSLAELASQSSLVQRVLHLLEVSSPFVFLSGSAGSGKSTLCESLLSCIERPWAVAYLDYQEQFTASRARELLVQQCFSGAVFDPSEPLPDSLFRLLGHGPRHFLLVIDSAEKMPQELVAELWDFVCINDALPQAHHLGVILCGESRWAEKQARGLKGRDTPPLELDVEPLSVREQTELFDFCLRSSGFTARMPNAQAVADRLRACEGNPGKIVELAESIMERNTNSPLKGREIPLNKVLATAAVIAAVTLLLSWLLPPLLQKPSEKEEISGGQPAVTDSASVSTVNAPTVEEGNAVLPAATEGELTADEDQTKENRRVVIADKVVKQIIASQQGGKVTASGAVTAQPTAVTAQSTAVASGAVTSVEQLPALAKELNGSKTQNEVNKPSAAVKPAKATSATPAAAKPSAAQLPVTKSAPTTMATGAANLADIKSKSPRHYTLQLSAGADKVALQAYARQLTLAESSWIYQTEYKGKPWYVLIQGDYATSAKAKAAVANLPALARKGQPWPKSYGQVQKEMK